MPRVLIVTHEFAGSGAAVMLDALLDHWLRDHGWQVDLYRFDPRLPIPGTLTGAGARIVDRINPDEYALALANSVAQPHLVRAVARQLAERVPCMLWVHEGGAPLWHSDLKAAEWRDLFAAFALVVFQTPWQRDKVFASFIAPLDSRRVAIVPNGLPPFATAPSPPERPADGRRRVIFLGNLQPRKRPQDLAIAVERLGRTDIECVFAGSAGLLGPWARDLTRLVEARHSDFRLLGEMPRAAALAQLAASDLLCLPSAEESQALVLLEAASLGIPFCSADLPCYGGIWQHGRDCLLYPVGKTDLLALQLSALLDSEAMRRSLAAEARRTARRFDFRLFADMFTGLARSLIRDGGRA